MDNKQIDDYFGPFATSLRKLMECHPVTKKVVTPAELAEVLATSTQTISFYINGKRKPSYDNLVALCEYFQVSADYLMFGIESDNRALNEQTGLTNEAINMLTIAHETNKYPDTVDISEVLSSLLSDRDFYVFLEDLEFHASEIKKLDAMDLMEREKKYPGINMPGYSKWCLHQDINEFILSQLEKRGMKIDRDI